uniref:putative disease resistance RPP13-like protein 1 n=1 Tax=Erigeron canadensis TaxID=72917 RepID=UPI001CB9A44E|nr:putative disease resistance RPP13-like protein 1 [Erigeron canadensis]
MAEIILSALLPIVFEKLASAASNKVTRSKKIQSQLQKLETSLPLIQDLLNDAAEKEIQDKRVKIWLNRLQHLANDIDDILDSLATDVMHYELTEKPAGGITKKVTKFIPTCGTSTFSSSNTDMHHKLNDITTNLQQLYNERNDLGTTIGIRAIRLFDSKTVTGNKKEKTSTGNSTVVETVTGRRENKKLT